MEKSQREPMNAEDRVRKLANKYADIFSFSQAPAAPVKARVVSPKSEAALKRYLEANKKSPEDPALIVQRQKLAAKKRADARKQLLAKESDEERGQRLRNEKMARELRVQARLLTMTKEQQVQFLADKANKQAQTSSRGNHNRKPLTEEQKKRNQHLAKLKSESRTEEQKEADRERARKRYADLDPHKKEALAKKAAEKRAENKALIELGKRALVSKQSQSQVIQI